MGFHKETVFLALTLLAASEAFLTLIPTDKEAVYSYRALVKAGTQIPVNYGSVFLLEGKLHIQADTNSTRVQLRDLTFKLYNGILNHVDELKSKALPVPDEFVDLTKPFRIIYEKSGRVLGISLDDKESENVKNIKKSIAAILQMDMERISLTETVPRGFMAREKSIYHRETDYLYSVVPYGDIIEVEKLHDMPSDGRMFHGMFTNLVPLGCERRMERPVTHDSRRKYILTKKDDRFVCKKISASGTITFYPFNVKSDAYFVLANQTMKLVDLKPVEKQIELKSETFIDDLTQRMFTEMENGAIHDVTHGRMKVSMDKLMQEMLVMLDDIVKYVRLNHIKVDTPDIKHGQSITRLTRLMMMMDKPTLIQMFEQLIQKKSELDREKLDVFLQILPLVGTKASLMCIKDLIWQKKVKDEVAINMLEVMSMYVKVPRLQMLTDMEMMIAEDDTITWPVRKAAILCFSVLVDKVHRRNTFDHERFLRHEDRIRDREVTEVRTTEMDKYVMEFINRIRKQTDKYEHQKVYLEALQNMRLDIIPQLLEPLIRGKWFEDRHLRLLGMWAVVGPLMRDSERVMEMFWPIMSNRHEYPELRASAYFLIMESNPSKTALLNMFWFMHSERDRELYHFYYTHIKNLLRTTEPCRLEFRQHLREIFKYLQTPDETTLSGYYQVDYMDPKYKFGGGLSGIIFNTNKTKIFSLSTTANFNGIPVENCAIVLKVDGLESGLMDRFRLYTQSSTKLFNYDEIMDFIRTISDKKDIRIEGSVLRQTYIVHSFFFDHTNVKDIGFIWDMITKDRFSLVKDVINIDYGMYNVMMMPCDFGMPVAVDFIFPRLDAFKLNLVKEGSDKVINWRIDWRFKRWAHARYGLSLYNPIVDLWQGVNRYHSFDINIPMLLDIAVNTQQQKMKITWKRQDDVDKDIIGLRTHVATMVFMKEYSDKNLLKQSSSDCQPFEFVSRGEDFRHRHTIVMKDDPNTGYMFDASVFDHEPIQHITNGTLLNSLYDVLTERRTKNYQTVLGYTYLVVRHMYFLKELLPTQGMHGYVIRAIPSTENRITHIDISLRLTQDIKRDDNMFMPAMTLGGRITYVLKNGDKAVRTWDLNTVMELNKDHTDNLKMDLTRIIPGQKDFKLCYEETKKFVPDGVTGRMQLAMGQSSDAKCTKDETILDITSVGRISDERRREHRTHGACVYPRTYHQRPDDYTMRCLSSFSDIRDYEYDIKLTNMPIEFKKTLALWMDRIKGHYISHYTYLVEHEVDVPENTMKVRVEYPLVDDLLDVEVIMPKSGWRLEGIRRRELGWLGVEPDNMYFSDWFKFLHTVGLTDVCLVDNVRVRFGWEHWGISHQLPSDWTLIMGDGASADNKMFSVFAKKLDEHRMALKVTHETNTLEIVPESDGLKLVVDGQDLKHKREHFNEWMSFVVLPFKKDDALFPADIMIPHIGLHLKFDGTQVKMELPRTDLKLKGTCVGN